MRFPCVAWLVCFVAVSMAGCSGESPSRPDSSASARPFVGRTVRVLAPAPIHAAERWPLIVSEFENEWGARAEVAEYDPTADESPWRSTRATPVASGPATLVLFPLSEFSELHARRPLATIPRDERDGSTDAGSAALDWSDLFGGLRNNVCSLGGEPAVIPISAPVLVCYFRRDLLENAGLQPPLSWDDYQKLLDSLAEWAPGLTAVEPWGPEYRATMFLARAVGSARHPGQYSLFFDVETGEPLIDAPGFVRGLEHSVAAVSRMPAETRTYSPAECRREILAGRAALAVAFEVTGDAARFPVGPGGWADSKPSLSASDAHGQSPQRAEAIVLGISPLPGATEVYNRSIRAWERPRGGAVNRVPLTGFAGLCAGVIQAADAESRQAAWKLLARLTGDEFDTAFRREVTTLCRTSQTRAPSRWVGEELRGDEGLAYVAAVSESLRDPLLVAELPVVGRDRFRQALAEALDDALAGTATPAEALGTAAQSWRQIADEIGIDAVRDSYRISLGLPPATR